MKRLLVTGGSPLRGSVPVLGAKNAISKQLVASLLTDEQCVFHNVPPNDETAIVLAILQSLGSEYQWLTPTSLAIRTRVVKTHRVGEEYSGYNRMPILFLGPLLHRLGKATVPLLGGCKIGQRPVDFHLDGLRRMGVTLTQSSQGLNAETPELVGADFELPFPSVGATENLLFAAVLAKGTTVIANAAIEPEIIDTILVLQKMGARVHLDVDRRIVVDGVTTLHGVEHTVIPDRMEVAAFAAAAVATGGDIEVLGARQEDVVTLISVLRTIGAHVEITDRGIRFSMLSPGRAAHIETNVHPGFMTDWQQPLVVALTQATGPSVVHETIYENRFGFTSLLNQMGADITLSSSCLGKVDCRFANKNFSHSAVVVGPTLLRAADVNIPDLRAGFAYVIAALVAKGQSSISGLHHLERGHANLVERLLSVGAEIKVVEE